MWALPSPRERWGERRRSHGGGAEGQPESLRAMLRETSQHQVQEEGAGVWREDRAWFAHLPWRSLHSMSSFPRLFGPLPFLLLLCCTSGGVW